MPVILKEKTYDALLNDQKAMVQYKAEMERYRGLYEDVSKKNRELYEEINRFKNGLSFKEFALRKEQVKALEVHDSAKLSVQKARQEARNAKERSKRLKAKNSELIRRLSDFTKDLSSL